MKGKDFNLWPANDSYSSLQLKDVSQIRNNEVQEFLGMLENEENFLKSVGFTLLDFPDLPDNILEEIPSISNLFIVGSSGENPKSILMNFLKGANLVDQYFVSNVTVEEVQDYLNPLTGIFEISEDFNRLYAVAAYIIQDPVLAAKAKFKLKKIKKGGIKDLVALKGGLGSDLADIAGIKSFSETVRNILAEAGDQDIEFTAEDSRRMIDLAIEKAEGNREDDQE